MLILPYNIPFTWFTTTRPLQLVITIHCSAAASGQSCVRKHVQRVCVFPKRCTLYSQICLHPDQIPIYVTNQTLTQPAGRHTRNWTRNNHCKRVGMTTCANEDPKNNHKTTHTTTRTHIITHQLHMFQIYIKREVRTGRGGQSFLRPYKWKGLPPTSTLPI